MAGMREEATSIMVVMRMLEIIRTTAAVVELLLGRVQGEWCGILNDVTSGREESRAVW